VLTPGQRQERRALEPLLEQGAVRRPGQRGRPRLHPRALAADKGYTGRTARAYLRAKHIHAVIPRLSNEPRRGTRFDRAAYRERNHVERGINRLKQFRRVATRYEKLAATYLAFVTIAAILLWC
jgi:transposase